MFVCDRSVESVGRALGPQPTPRSAFGPLGGRAEAGTGGRLRPRGPPHTFITFGGPRAHAALPHGRGSETAGSFATAGAGLAAAPLAGAADRLSSTYASSFP